MSASQSQAAEARKDPDHRKADPPRMKIRIRLPPRKRLASDLLIAVEEANNTNNSPSKKAPENTDKQTPSKNLTTAGVRGDASNNCQKGGLCHEANSNSLSKTLPAESGSYISTNKLREEINESILSKNFSIATTGVQGNDASIYPAKEGLCEEANNSTLGKPLPVTFEELPEEIKESTLSKNRSITTTELQGNDATIYPAKEGLCEKANNSTPRNPLPVLFKELTEEINESTLSKNLSIITTCVQGSDAIIYPAKEGLCEEADNSTPRKPLPVPFRELPEEPTDNIPNENLATAAGLVEEEKINSPRKRLLYDTTSNIPSKVVPEEAKDSNFTSNIPSKVVPEEIKDNKPSWTLTTTAVKLEEVFEQICKHVPTKKPSDEAERNAPISRPTDQSNKKTSRKKLSTSELQTTSTIQNTSGLKLSSSVGQAVEQSSNAANFMGLKEYQELEETIERTVFVENFSHQATEPVIITALNQFGTVRKGNDASIYAAKEGLCEDACNTTSAKPLAMSFKELPEEPIDIPSKNLATTAVQVEEEKNNSPKKRLLCDTTSIIPSNVVSEEAKDNKLSRNLTTTAVKFEEVFKQVCKHIPTKKRSGKAEKRAPVSRPTDQANQNTSSKKPCTSVVQTTSTIQNTSGLKLSSSVGQAVEQSSSAANFMAVKEYQEFEEMVKRTIYFDNLSHQVTEAVIRTALNQCGTVRKVSFLVNYTVPYNIPQSALVEMETEKDAVTVVTMLQEFPFMMVGMPRPVRAKHATAEMFNDRPRRPGTKLKFWWVDPTDPDYVICKKIKLMTRRHEMENLALIKHELEVEQSLAKEQEDNLNCNYGKLLSVDSVILPGLVDQMFHIYGIKSNEGF